MKVLWLIAWLPCALLVGSAPASGAARDASSGPGSVSRAAQPAQAAQAESLLYASPTTLDLAGRIIAPVMVDGSGPYRFIVDTGAGYSSLSPALAKRLGLDPLANAALEINGITGSARVPSAAIRLLQAGDLRLVNQRLPVVWAPVMAGAAGILGVAGLTHDCITVNFKWNRVRISRCGWLEVPVHGEEIRAMRLKGGLIAIRARIGSVRLPAIIDTGSAHTLGNLALRAALGLPTPAADSPAVTQVYGVTPTIAKGDVQPSPAIRLGRIVAVSGGSIVYGDFHIFHVWGLTHRPAVIIGMDVLGTVKRLGIDFAHPQIYLEGARPPSHDFEQQIY